MIAFEEHVRLLLVLHTISALVLVATSTHLLVWLYRFVVRGKGARRAVVRFSLLSTGFFALTMVLGLLVYPTYKVRVRSEYLDNPAAIGREVASRDQARVHTRTRDLESLRYRTGESAPVDQTTLSPEMLTQQIEDAMEDGRSTALWFDVKEHWVALGFLLSAANTLLLWVVRKREALQSMSFAVLALAFLSMATTWAAAIIGVLTAATRAVG